MMGKEPQPDSHKGGTACLCEHTVDWPKGQDSCWLPCQPDHLTRCSRSLTVVLSPHTGISGCCRPGLSKSDTAVLHGLRHSRPAMQRKIEVRSVQDTRQCPHHSLASSCATGPCSNVPASQAHANGSVLNHPSCSCALVCVHTSPVDVPAAIVCDTRCRIALHGWRAALGSLLASICREHLQCCLEVQARADQHSQSCIGAAARQALCSMTICTAQD